MDLAELQRRIDQHARLDLTPLYEAYRAQSGADDVDGFLAFLGSSRILDTALLKELHGLGDVEVPTIDDPALQGTVLAAWVAGATTLPDPGSGTLPSAAQASRGSRSTAPAAEIRYEPVALLGQGAMGAIRIARDVYLRRKVALKTVLPEMATHPQLLGRFLSEMQITAQLEHPNIVPIYALEVGADGSLGYAMKLVQGQDLAQILDATRETLDKGQPIDEDHKLEKRLEYFLKVCDALEFGHSKGIVHRDLKPANIYVHHAASGERVAKVLDFGISKVFESEGRGAFNLTRAGTVVGSPAYMSPEQAAGRDDLDGRADVWSLGVVMYEALTGTLPHDAPNYNALMVRILVQDADPVSKRNPNLPPVVAAVVDGCLRRDRDQRMASAGVLAQQMEAAIKELRGARYGKVGRRATDRMPTSGPSTGRGSLPGLPASATGAGVSPILQGNAALAVAGIGLAVGLTALVVSILLHFR